MGSTLSIAEMRKKIAKAYPSAKWQDRVYRMPERQVYAVYFSLRDSGRLEPKKQKKPKYEQITMYDYFGKEILDD